MNTQTETKQIANIAETLGKTKNPMQERHCGPVAESVDVTAEAILAARRYEVQKNAGQGTGLLFVP